MLQNLPPPTSRFSPLAPLLQPKLAPFCHIILSNHQNLLWLGPVMVLHYICAWCPTPCMHVTTSATVYLSGWSTRRVVSSRHDDRIPSPSGPVGPSPIIHFFSFSGPSGRVRVSLQYLSVKSFLMFLGYIILDMDTVEGDFSYRFGMFHLEH